MLMFLLKDGILALANVEAAYRHETQAKEAIEEFIELCSLYQLQDSLNAADQQTDENRLLPAMNKIWPFFVVCVQNSNPAVCVNFTVLLFLSLRHVMVELK